MTKDQIDPSFLYVPNADVVESRLGGETVMLHLGKAVYFGLDEVGTIVWEQLQQGKASDAICAHIRSTLEEVPDTVDADVDSFIADLLDHGILVRNAAA